MSSAEALAILEPAATRVRDPQSGRSVWLAGMIQNPHLHGDRLSFTLRVLPEHAPPVRQRLREALERNISRVGWKGTVTCTVAEAPRQAQGGPKPTLTPPGQHSHGEHSHGEHSHAQHSHAQAPPGKAPVRGMGGGGMQPHGGPIKKHKLDGVRHIVAVASGKGGVGKSTVATNLAVALAQAGHSVGLMDADIYGPSLPMMMDVRGKPVADADRKILPLQRHGVRCMSIGFLVDDREPIIWRGPMVMGVVRQFLHDVKWGELDMLVIDLPPGTGDAQLTLIQAVDLSGAVVVTTPQDVAVLDAVRGVEMFRKLDVPVLGIVENMSWMEIPGGERMHPFGSGGGQRTAEQYDVPLLAQVPLDSRVRAGGDEGRPRALDEADDGVFRGIARSVLDALTTIEDPGR